MVTRAEWYTRVNEAWGKDPLPKLTYPEARRALKKIWRAITGEKFTYVAAETSGNRFTWSDGMYYRVNAEAGWHRFIHDVSHRLHRKVNPGKKPHAKSHARLELKIIKLVRARGWLEGRLKDPVRAPAPVPTAVEVRQAKLGAVLRRIKKWESRGKRVRTALRGLRASERGLRRALSAQAAS